MILAVVTYTLATLQSLELAAAKLKLEREQAVAERVATAWDPEFRGAGLKVQELAAPEWMLSGPYETAKTTAGLWRLDSDARRYPKSQWTIVQKVRAAMYANVLTTYDAIITARGGVKRFGGHQATSYVYENGAEVFVAGLDNPGKALSGNRDGIYVCQAEQTTIEDWEALVSRVSGRGARGASVNPNPYIGGDCNPDAPTHWIKHRPRLELLDTYHRDNPSLFYADGTPTQRWLTKTQPMLESLTGVRRERMYFGRWVAAEGVVFESFDRNVHVIDRFPIPSGWRYVAGVDFGYKNPFSWGLFAVSPDGVMYLVREIYMTGRTVRDHAERILRETAGIRVEATVCDHDAEDCATLREMGISTVLADKQVRVGIEELEHRLRHGKGADGVEVKPRLFLFRDALVERDEELARKFLPSSTEQEFAVYAYAKSAAGRPLKDEPEKRYDHAMDRTRYVAMYLRDRGDLPAIEGMPRVRHLRRVS